MATNGSDSIMAYLHRQRWSIVVGLLVLLLVAGVAYFFRPLLDGVVFGIFFAYVTRPVKGFLSRYTRFAPLLATFCILLPVLAIFSFAIVEFRVQVLWLTQHGDEARAQIEAAMASLSVPPGVIAEVNNVLANLTDYLIAFAGTIPIRETFSGLLHFGTNALMSIFVCFYLLKDGDKVVSTLGVHTPARFRPAMDFFTTEADRILYGIYIGTFYTALFIALMSALLFFLFGVPYLALFTAFVFVAAMVPILSGMMVILPLTLYLYVGRGLATAALFLTAALALVYIPPDFLIRPYLINRASNIHPLLIIMSFIGGGLAGGISGFFAAPLLVGLLVAVYRTYMKYGEKTIEGASVEDAKGL